MPQTSDESVLCATFFITLVHDLIAAITIIGCIFFLIFAQLNATNWITAGAVVLSSLVAFGIIWLIAYLVTWLHKEFKADNIQKCRNNLAIGFGGIAICGIAPRIIVYFIGYNVHLIFFGLIVFPVIATFIYCFFILEQGNLCEIYPDKHGKSVAYSIIAHIILLIITARIATTNYEDKNELGMIIICQIGCSFICASSTIELFIVLTGGLKMKSNIGQEQRPVAAAAENRPTQNGQNDGRVVIPVRIERLETVAPVVDNNSRLECEICALGFSVNSLRIPRMLKECGHTICEGCAEKLLQKNNRQHLYCPFCKKVTIVNGSASLLPKNYIALDLVQNAV